MADGSCSTVWDEGGGACFVFCFCVIIHKGCTSLASKVHGNARWLSVFITLLLLLASIAEAWPRKGQGLHWRSHALWKQGGLSLSLSRARGGAQHFFPQKTLPSLALALALALFRRCRSSWFTKGLRQASHRRLPHIFFFLYVNEQVKPDIFCKAGQYSFFLQSSHP